MTLPSRRVALAAALLCCAGRAWAQDGFVGTWRGHAVNAFGQQMPTEVIFMPNGTYTAAAQTGSAMTRHWGRYEVAGNQIRLFLHGAEPRQFCGPVGCTRIAWPETETWTVTRFDGRTLETPTGRLQRMP